MSGATDVRRRRFTRLLRGATWAAPALWLACDLALPLLRPAYATTRLRLAVRDGNTPGVRRALAKGADPDVLVWDADVMTDTINDWRMLALIRDGTHPLLTSAAVRCDGEAIRSLLSPPPVPGRAPRTPLTDAALTDALQVAAAHGNASALSVLLETRAARDRHERSAVLRTAMEHRRTEAVRALLARGFRLIPTPLDLPEKMLASTEPAERLVARATWPCWKPAKKPAATAAPASPRRWVTAEEAEGAATARRREEQARAAAEAAAGWGPFAEPPSLHFR